MTSSKRQAANAANAQRSTGPRSAAGKAHSRLNAFKHGLAIRASAVPDLAPDVAHLAQIIAGEKETDPRVLTAATRVAEASVDLLRARHAKTELLDRLLQGPEFWQDPPPEEPMPPRPRRLKVSVSDYERAFRAGVGEQLRGAEEASIMHELTYGLDVDRIRGQRAEAEQRAHQRRSEWQQLEKLDRYERRALSRRKSAIRAFDEVRTAAQVAPAVPAH